jgi:hypothetical protein
MDALRQNPYKDSVQPVNFLPGFRLLLLSLGVLFLLSACGPDITGPGGSKVPFKTINGDQVLMAGYIEHKDFPVIFVFETAVYVNEMTEIVSGHGEPLGFEDLLVGSWVAIQASFVEELVVADRIDVETRAEEAPPTD